MIDQAFDRIARRGVFDRVRQLGIGVEALDGLADSGRQNAQLFGGSEAAQLELGPNFRRIRERAHELAEQEIDTAVRRRCRHSVDEPAGDAPDGPWKRCPQPSGRRIGEKRRIATEELVTAVAAERHLDRSPGGARECVLRQERAVDQRLVEETPDPLDQRPCVGGREYDLVVLGAASSRHEAREAAFVVAGRFEADREGLKRRGVRLARR